MSKKHSKIVLNNNIFRIARARNLKIDITLTFKTKMLAKSIFYKTKKIRVKFAENGLI